MNSLLLLFSWLWEGWREALLRACWQGAIAMALVWLVCRAWPRLPAGARCWLWRLAFLKLLLALFWTQPVTLPLVSPRPAPAPPPSATILPGLPAHLAVVDSPLPLPISPADASGRTASNGWESLRMAGAAWGGILWLLGIAWCGLRLPRDWRRVRRLLRASRPLEESRARALAADLARQFGLRRSPELRVMEALEGPLLVGALRPVILLPAPLIASCTETQLRLVLAHEMAHARRRDLLWAWIPALTQTFFFFHPLVWLAQREARLAQEIACDEAALRVTAAPTAEYGQVLVQTAVSPGAVSMYGWGTAGISERYHTLKRRLAAMKQRSQFTRRQLLLLGGVLALLGVAGLVPWRMPVRAAAGAAVDEKAEALYNEAQGMDPNRPEARARVFSQAVERCPGEIRYRIALGDTFLYPASDGTTEAERLPRAHEAYREAAAAVPTSPIPHSRLADLAWETDKAAAAAHLEKAIALDAENALPVYQRAALHFLAGEDEQGRKLLLSARARRVIRHDLMMPTCELSLTQASASAAVQAAQTLPRLAAIRELARQAVRVATEMQRAGDQAGARELLIEAQRAGSRLITAEPRTLISALVGIVVDKIVCKDGLEPLATKMEDARSLERLAARREMHERWREGAKKMMARLSDPAFLNPTRRITLWKDEGQMVQELLDQSGWKETIDEME